MKNRRSSPWLVLLVIGLVLRPPYGFSQNKVEHDGDSRAWTNTQGKAVQGTLLGVEGEEVRLLVKGNEFVIPLSGLSAADNEYVREWMARLSVARTRGMRVLRSQGSFEILGKDGEVVDEGTMTGKDPPDDSPPMVTVSELNDPGKAKQRATQHAQVFAGQSIRTASGANVDLYSTAGAVIQVQGESELQIPERSETESKGSLRLLKGSLFLNVDAKSLQDDREEFRLTTPTALLAVKGTQFFARANPDGTESGVYEGKVEGSNFSGESAIIEPWHIAEFLENEVKAREMTGKEKEDRKVFNTLAVTKSSLAERTWGWNHFDWEVSSLLRKDGPTGASEITSVNINRGQNQAGHLAIQFRPVDGNFTYGEFRIDTVVSDFGENLLGAEFRIRANRDLKILITTIGADQKELARKKRGLLDPKGYEFLVEFHDLETIREHKNLYWEGFQLEKEKVNLEEGQWTTHFAPFSKSDYPKDYEVKSWFVFLCLGPEEVAKREVIALEVPPPVLVFKSESAQ